MTRSAPAAPADDAPEHLPPPPGAAPGDRPLRTAAEAAVVAVAAVGWAAYLYRIWDASLRVPLYQDRSDARIISNLVQNIHTSGWFQSQPHLGAPYGQAFYDFPHGGETWQMVAIKVITLFSDDYGLTMNVYFMAGFGVTAAVTYLVLRHLRFGALAAGIAAFLYTFLPFHFYHEQSHLFRSSYFYAPLACLLLLWSLSWRTRFLLDPAPPAQATWWKGVVWNLRHNLRPARVAAAVAVAVVLGGTETMTTSFTLVLLATTGLVVAIHRREPAQLLVSAALAAVLAATFLLLLWPTFNYVRTYGTNGEAARRDVTDQERYGLKIDAMVLPSVDHRSSAFNKLGNEAQTTSTVRSEGGMALTTLGALGFLGALWWSLTQGVGPPASRHRRAGDHRRDLRPHDDRRALLDHSSLLIVVGTLFATIAGFAMVLSVIGFAQVRVWNRMAILIAFLSAVVTLIGLERLARRLRPRFGTAVLLLAGIGLGLFGWWDGGKPAARDYDALAADFKRDRDMVERLEASVPDGTRVFQLPIVPFPEAPPQGVALDYDHLRPWLHSDGSTYWSYGGVRGRPHADWQDLLVGVPVADYLPALLGMGFDGLWIDRWAYADGGEAITAEVEYVVGGPELRASDGRYLYFDLSGYRDDLGRTEASLRAEARRRFGLDPPA